MHSHDEPAYLASSDEDYERFKITRGRVEQREDGLRLDTGAPNIEWWYFDCTLDDGADLAIIFCTKDASRKNQPLEPLIEIDIDMPDGTRLMKYGYFKADEFEASKDGCDVRMGEYRFKGDLHEYSITGKAEDVSAEVKLETLCEPFRPDSGHIVFGTEGRDIFAWTAFVPYGKVTATYRIGDEVHQATGTGYHDHNWMNKEMGHLLDHWWWAKGKVGPYELLSAHLVTSKKYDFAPIQFFMLSRDGKIIVDDSTKVAFTT
ncbi:MAG: hydroxyneurosporene dehydrogenase, partial [Chloroflexi bacterium]|nr:hydroxyneurosporene dehydrogenase [Chloroflexota bacterium]